MGASSTTYNFVLVYALLDYTLNNHTSLNRSQQRALARIGLAILHFEQCSHEFKKETKLTVALYCQGHRASRFLAVLGDS